MRTGPDYIQFYPTLRCNQACGFCFNRTMPARGDMQLRSFELMLEKLKEASVKTIDIIGGEPTLHGDIAAMVRQATALGFSVNVSSNGSDLDTLGKLMDLGPLVSAGISINEHETLARTAAFVQSRRPVVKTVFSPFLDKGFVRSILALNPSRFYLIYRDVLEQGDMRDAVAFPEFAAAAKAEFGPAGIGTVFCSGFIVAENDSPELRHVRCPAGTTKLGVMPDGSVYPCNLFFGREEFLLGNILADAFETIWASAVLSPFRARNRNACDRPSCPHHGQCHGGCPAQSLLLGGSLSAPDPRCAVR